MLAGLVGVGALSSQVLQRLTPGSMPSPDAPAGTPPGAEGSEESLPPAGQQAARPVPSPADDHLAQPSLAAGQRPSSRERSDGGGGSRPASDRLATGRREPQRHGGPLASPSAPLRSRRNPAGSSLPAAPAPDPSRSPQGADVSPVDIAEPWPDAIPAPAAATPLVPAPQPATRPALRGQDGVRQLGVVTLSDLDPSQGGPCSDTTAALPADPLLEEALSPGSDDSSTIQSAALDPIPVPPSDPSGFRDPAGGSSPPALQANRPPQCLPTIPLLNTKATQTAPAQPAPSP